MANILKLPESIEILVNDFHKVKLTLDKGKTVNSEKAKVNAVRKPSEQELKIYAKRLRSELDEFTEGSNEKHLVKVIYSDDLIVCQVNLIDSEKTQKYFN